MSEEAPPTAAPTDAAAPPPAKKKRRGRKFKNANGKPKAALAELKETEQSPLNIQCVEYTDDEAALLAEENIAADVTDMYTDHEWKGMDSIYKDFSRPPMGALPADLIKFCRISALEITGIDNPTLFPATVQAAENKDAKENKEEEKVEGGDESKNENEDTSEGKDEEDKEKENMPMRLDDLVQGQLENRWWLTALAPLLDLPTYLRNLFVSKRHAAKGLYTVKIFKEGRWRYVHIDDTIPCDMAGVPLFSRSTNPNATWILLLEKAYAKLHGCYERLGTGVVEEAMRDLTLGVACSITIPKPSLNEKGEGIPQLDTNDENSPTNILWAELASLVPANKDNRHVLRMKGSEGLAVVVRTKEAAPMKAGRAVDPRRSVMTGRGYALRLMLTVEDPENKAQFKLVLLRNPWGMRSWGGDWGHGDIKWDENPRIKGLVGSLAPEYTWNPEDGMFWMSWSDFCVQFDRIRAVRLPSNDWTLNRFHGEWLDESITDGRGGRPGSPDFPINPMFGFEYTGGSIPKMMISLSQKETRWRADEGAPLCTSEVSGENRLPAVGFVVVQLTGDHLRLHEYWRGKIVATSSGYQGPHACIRSRDAANGFFTISEGRYAVIPFTYESGEGGGGNAFFIDMWSDYDLQVFECFQEDAVSEPPDSDEEEEEGEGEEGGEKTEGDEGKESETKVKATAEDKEPDFLTLEHSPLNKENLEELTLMAMQRTISNLCSDVQDLRREIGDLNTSVRKISATR